MTNSKNKGNSFERSVATQLSERFATFTSVEKAFRRNPDSGAYFGGTNVSRTETHLTDKATFGDIICPPNFIFNIEAKHYKNPPSLSSILKEQVTDWNKWLAQAKQDSAAADKKLLLIVLYNNTDTMALGEKEVLPSGVL